MIAVKNYLKARMDRARGSILGYCEREVYPKLTPQERTALRSVVLDALNMYHDSVLDIMKSDDSNDELRNEKVLELLEKIYVRLEEE